MFSSRCEQSSSLRFLVSHGGAILPRFPDAQLHYVGGDTRLLVVPRSTTFPELMKKMEELFRPACAAATLRCRIPGMDLDELVTVKTEEDLGSLVEEWDQSAAGKQSSGRSPADGVKIRAFLFSRSRGDVRPSVPSCSFSSLRQRRQLPELSGGLDHHRRRRRDGSHYC